MDRTQANFLVLPCTLLCKRLLASISPTRTSRDDRFSPAVNAIILTISRCTLFRLFKVTRSTASADHQRVRSWSLLAVSPYRADDCYILRCAGLKYIALKPYTNLRLCGHHALKVTYLAPLCHDQQPLSFSSLPKVLLRDKPLIT